MKWKLVFTATLAVCLCGWGQEFRGAIAGAVTDASGGAIPGAKVTVTETSTGTKYTAESDAAGNYLAPSLLPGDYEITVKATGFKEFIRKGVHLGAGDKPTLDVQMQVGDAAVTVEVTADAPLIVSENASIGNTITTKEIEDLPSNGGTPMMSAGLTMGVIATGQPSTVQPFASAAAPAGASRETRRRPTRS